MFRSRSWFGGPWGRPKNPHSLEHLKYLYNVLSRNQTVSEHNRGLLVETLRSIAEILIWGDQNDSSVFEYDFCQMECIPNLYCTCFQLLFGEEYAFIFPENYETT